MSPKGAFLMTNIAKNEDIETTIKDLSDKIKGISIDTLIVSKYMLGVIDNRLYDKTQSRQYELLISSYNYTKEKIRDIINNKNQ